MKRSHSPVSVRSWAGVDLRMWPSEYVRRFFRLTFIEDQLGVQLGNWIDIDVVS